MFKKIAVPAILVACAYSAQADLIVNGSFENTPALSNGSWGTFDSIQGWTAESTGTEYNPIEVGQGGVYGVTGFDGNNIAELNSYGRSRISQTISGLSAGEELNMSFLAGYRQDPNTSLHTNSIEVLWNGNAVQTFNPTSSVMSLESLHLTAVAGDNKLSFQSVGDESSYGGIIDNVKMQAVPEPAPFAALGLGFGFLGLARRRRA